MPSKKRKFLLERIIEQFNLPWSDSEDDDDEDTDENINEQDN